MSAKEVKTDDRYHIDFSWVKYAPIMVLLGIIPLIVRLALINLDQAVMNVLGITQVPDFFSQYKSTFIMISAAIMIFMFFLIFDKKDLKKDKTMNVYYIAGGVFMLLTLLSAFFSEYRSVALWGIADRFEGGVVIGAYVIIMFYTIYVFKNEADYKYIVWPLAFIVLISTALGLTQYLGEDFLLNTELGRKLIVPEKYAAMRDTLKPLYAERRAYGTMFHYNYIGSFTAMMIPLFGTLTLFIRGRNKKLIFGSTTVLSAALLLMSTSRAGIIGVILSAIVFVVIFAKVMLRKWKFIVPAVVALLVLLIGANVVTKGAILERVPSLMQDAVALFVPAGEKEDPVNKLPLQNIRHEDNKTILEIQSTELSISYQENQLVFQDQNQQKVAFDFDGTRYTTADARFNAFAFTKLNESLDGLVDWGIQVEGQNRFYLRASEAEGVHLIDGATLQNIELEIAKAVGFKGKERLGSSRGYIWSRSIPMFKDSLLLGNGPDTYVLKFPQRDYLGKWAAYDTTNMVVDKAHNLYLQIGINQGVLALIAFLVLVGFYVVQSMMLYSLRRFYESREAIGAGIALAVVGYLGAGIFNDSVVSVAPIFWVLLGFGIALNHSIYKERKIAEKSKAHATINMKTKKHI